MWVENACVILLGVNFIECYNPDKYPPIQCGCNVVNVTSDGGRISEYHPQKLGEERYCLASVSVAVIQPPGRTQFENGLWIVN